VLDNIETWSTTRRVLGWWLREIVKVRLDMNDIKNRTFNKSIKLMTKNRPARVSRYRGIWQSYIARTRLR